MPQTPEAKRKLRAKRRALGLCWCGRTPEKGKTHCTMCLKNSVRKRKARRAKGLCFCGRMPAAGKKLCSVCLDNAKRKTAAVITRGICVYCFRRRAASGRLCNRCRDTVDAQRKKLKLDVINGYGGRCMCCGETETAFLCIDHIHNDGASERKQGIKGSALYTRLRKLGYPKDRYQLLCHNCNIAKQIEGSCPHRNRYSA